MIWCLSSSVRRIFETGGQARNQEFGKGEKTLSKIPKLGKRKTKKKGLHLDLVQLFSPDLGKDQTNKTMSSLRFSPFFYGSILRTILR